jgi:hypothetical protein
MLTTQPFHEMSVRGTVDRQNTYMDESICDTQGFDPGQDDMRTHQHQLGHQYRERSPFIKELLLTVETNRSDQAAKPKSPAGYCRTAPNQLDG